MEAAWKPAAILLRFFDANQGDCPFDSPWYADRQT